MSIISYGIGKDYLKHWNINEALREIFQNYLDYGEFKIDIKDFKTVVRVNIWNNYIPNNLEFLRIGHSVKTGDNNIGKHGEGLKMAFLVMIRNNWHIHIKTNKFVIYPKFIDNPDIGETLSLVYENHNKECNTFNTCIVVPKEEFYNYHNNIINVKDIIFADSYHGDIVDKPTGNIYSGNLFVCHLDNLSRSYNIPPSQLELDRDRAMPRVWDINYHTSKVNEKYARWSTKDTNYSDTEYISYIPEHLLNNYEPKAVGNSIQFVYKNTDGETEILKNESIKQTLLKHSYFTKAIHSIKKFIAKHLGLYELLIEFEKKHIHSIEAKQDFAIILELVKK